MVGHVLFQIKKIMPKPRFQACSFLLSTNKVVAGQQTQPACTLEIRHNGRYLLLKKQLCDVKGLHRGFIPYAQVSCTPIGRIVSAAGPRPGPWLRDPHAQYQYCSRYGGM